MLLSNLLNIIEENYISLVEEAWGEGRLSKTYVWLVFLLFPTTTGFILGIATPLWTDMISTVFTAIGVLTGFSINALVLLTSHSEEESYESKTKVVDQTKSFTLYAVLSGVALLVVLCISFLTVQYSSFTTPAIYYFGVLNDIQVFSIIVYTVLLHYFLVMLVLTHRLYTLVHGDALGNGK